MRFIMQPVAALFLAARDGYRDAVAGRAPYLHDIVCNPAGRSARLKEGFRALARVTIMSVVVDVAYQFVAMKAFRPIEMATVVMLLAFVPYFVARGPVRRITSRVMRHPRIARQGHRKGIS